MKELFISTANNTVAQNVYTDEMVSELESLSPMDNDKAAAFAEKHGLSVASVRAKAVRNKNIVYNSKPKTRKDGSAVETKAEIVESIAKLMATDAERLESLGNATRDVLVLVRAALS